MMCQRCNIDLAVRAVSHEIVKSGEALSLNLVQQLCCPKCNAEETITSPMSMTVKNA